MASLKRANRSLPSGHSMPSGASFIASPEPMPRMTRPGARQPRVANACATTPGWYRNVGVSTLVPTSTRSVLATSAPSQGSAAGACPPVCRQGWRWSLTNTESNPARSASTEKSISSRGANCSADALYPNRSMVWLLDGRPARGAKWNKSDRVHSASRWTGPPGRRGVRCSGQRVEPGPWPLSPS